MSSGVYVGNAYVLASDSTLLDVVHVTLTTPRQRGELPAAPCGDMHPLAGHSFGDWIHNTRAIRLRLPDGRGGTVIISAHRRGASPSDEAADVTCSGWGL